MNVHVWMYVKVHTMGRESLVHYLNNKNIEIELISSSIDAYGFADDNVDQ